MASIDEQVKQILREALDVTDEQLTPNAALIEDLGADSLDVMEIVMQLEEKFGIEVPDADLQKIRTVQEVIEYVKAHLPAEAKKH